jgi:hypothetical protein
MLKYQYRITKNLNIRIKSLNAGRKFGKSTTFKFYRVKLNNNLYDYYEYYYQKACWWKSSVD